jgi:hypothetical protein
LTYLSAIRTEIREARDSPLRRWTVRLVRELEDEIRSVDVEFDNLDVWCDENVDPTTHLTAELREKVKSSGILMVVISPRYLSSSWCKDELNWFREQVLARSDTQGRVFVVRVLPTSEADWPEFLRDERGTSLVGFRPQTGMPYGWRDVRENSEDYVRQLWTLQTALNRRLRELRRRAESRIAAPIVMPVSIGGQRIYLHSRAEDAPLRNNVRTQLTEAGLITLSPPGDSGGSIGDWAGDHALSRKDYSVAMVWYSKAADLGNAQAEVEIGALYRYGWGVQKNLENALNWYAKAAENGNAAAEYQVGLMYWRGEGTAADPKKRCGEEVAGSP